MKNPVNISDIYYGMLIGFVTLADVKGVGANSKINNIENEINKLAENNDRYCYAWDFVGYFSELAKEKIQQTN